MDTSGVEGVDPDLRVRPFFAHGVTISIREFVVGALQAEMGLQAVDPELESAAGAGTRFTTPAGMVLDGTLDRIEAPPTADPSADPDGDGVTHEIPTRPRGPSRGLLAELLQARHLPADAGHPPGSHAPRPR